MDYVQQEASWEEGHFFDVINQKIIPRHREALLQCSYKRPNSTILTILNGMRTRLPLIRRPGTKSNSSNSHDHDEDEVSDASDGTGTGESITATDLSPYLPKSQIKALQETVSRALQATSHPPSALLKSLLILECCGVSDETAISLRQTIHLMQGGFISK